MADINLTQADADALIAMEKHRADDQEWDYPALGGSIRVPLISPDRRENFYLDVSRGNINLSKATYQNRARLTVVLLRLDLGGPPHRNPDDTEILCPHLHIYREDYSDKWVIPAPIDIFTNTADLWQTLLEFMSHCNITQPPLIRKGLFP